MASLIQRSNGYYYLVTFLKGKRIWQSTGSKTKPGAFRFIKNHKKKAKADQKTNVFTLREFETQYLNYAATNLAPSTVTLYSGAINNFVKYCGDHNLPKYTPQMIEYFKVSHLKKVSPTKVNIDFRSMKSVFGTAVNWGLLRENPFKKCKQLRIPQRNPIYLTPEDFQKLISVISYDWFKDLVRFAVSTIPKNAGSRKIVSLKPCSVFLS
jgi:integrase